MTTYYAQPYDISAAGFYFESAASYLAKIDTIINDYGDHVEEFEIQFIDGETIDANLSNAIGMYQSTILNVMACIDDWESEQKLKVIIAVGECGYSFDVKSSVPEDFEIDLYADMTLNDLAYIFVDEGMFGDIPANVISYLDFEAIARDLGHDYTETTIAGVNYVYRCE
ncbi:MAG: antirestriction protein ArdA [Hyphomicrobiales bacterium]|nr:MAG: antirestriction protein ArdA [Hyphomicrobiales bacterium]